MKKLLVVLLLAVSLPVIVRAQYRIFGKISDSISGEALQGAHIIVNNTYLGAYSLKGGVYEIVDLKGGETELVFSFMGYEKKTLKIKLEKDQQMDVGLKKKAIMEQEVVVNATRADYKTPSTVHNIGKAEVQRLNLGQDIPFILDQSPSAVVSSDAGTGVGYTSLRIRGTDMTRINFTLNGIPLNDAESQGVWFVNMPDFASSAGNIQIQRGVGTSVNGAPAFGASVNMMTKSSEDHPYAEFNSSIGSFNTRKNTLMAGTGLINDHFAFDIRLSKINSDGYIDRAFSDLKSMFLSGIYYGNGSMLKLNILSGTEKTYQAWNGIPKVRLESDTAGMKRYLDHWLYSQEKYDEMLASNPRTYNLYTYENETDNYRQDHYQLLYSKWLSARFLLNTALHLTRGQGYYEQFKKDDDFADYGLDPVIIGGDTLSSSDLVRQKWLDNLFYGMVFSIQYDNNKWNMVVGGAANQYSGNHFGKIIWSKYNGDFAKDYEWYRNKGIKDDVSIYMKTSREVGRKTSIYGDIQYRWIHYRIEGTHDDLRDLSLDKMYHFINPKAGIFYEINSRNQCYLMLAMTNKEPSRNTFRDASGVEEPHPEKLFDLEAGYKYSAKNWLVSSNVFYMYYMDQLVPTGKINDVGSAILINVPESYRAGIEIHLNWKLHPKLVWESNVALSTNKILHFTEYVDNWDEGGQIEIPRGTTDIAFSPAIVSGSNIRFTPFQGLEISFLSKYVSRQFIDNSSNPDNTLNAWFVNDLLIAYTCKEYKSFTPVLSLKVNNLFNAEYESFAWVYRYFYEGEYYTMDGYFPQAGINFLMSVNVKF